MEKNGKVSQTLMKISSGDLAYIGSINSGLSDRMRAGFEQDKAVIEEVLHDLIHLKKNPRAWFKAAQDRLVDHNRGFYSLQQIHYYLKLHLHEREIKKQNNQVG